MEGIGREGEEGVELNILKNACDSDNNINGRMRLAS